MPLKDFKVRDYLHINIESVLTPDALADAFWCMDSAEQARFFHRFGYIAEDYPTEMVAQMLGVVKEKLTPQAIVGVKTIASILEYINGDDHG